MVILGRVISGVHLIHRVGIVLDVQQKGDDHTQRDGQEEHPPEGRVSGLEGSGDPLEEEDVDDQCQGRQDEDGDSFHGTNGFQ